MYLLCLCEVTFKWQGLVLLEWHNKLPQTWFCYTSLLFLLVWLHSCNFNIPQNSYGCRTFNVGLWPNLNVTMSFEKKHFVARQHYVAATRNYYNWSSFSAVWTIMSTLILSKERVKKILLKCYAQRNWHMCVSWTRTLKFQKCAFSMV